MGILDQQEHRAIEEACTLVDDTYSRKRKTTPVIRLRYDPRPVLPNCSSSSTSRRRGRSASDCGIRSSKASPASAEHSEIRITTSISASRVPRNGTSNLNTPSSSSPPKKVLQSFRFPGRVVYSRSPSDAENAVRELLDIVNAKKETTKISMGLDIEWRPTFRRGVAPRKASVLQLCVDAAHCFVLHIIHSGIPPLLHSLFEDESIPKVGVGIAGDASKLLKDYGVNVKGLKDLSPLANAMFSGTRRRWGLSSLTEMLISKQLEKPKRIQLGNWEADILSDEQLQYAATDAYASWYLHQVLDSTPDACDADDE